MAKANPHMGEINENPPRVSGMRRFFRVFLGRPVVVFGLVVIVILILVAILAPLLSPYDPYMPNLTETLQQPSWDHLLGTDALGRDTLSRILYGSQTSLMICLLVVLFSGSIGMSLGLIAGYFGGGTYTIIMRVMDAFMSFPVILLALVVAALLGGGVKNVVAALTIAMMPMYARLMCGQVLSVKENDYVMASHAKGASDLRIMLWHVAPNCFPPLIVGMTMQLGNVIMSEAGLSFLGIGIEAPIAAWGSMINMGRQHLLSLPILSFAPGAAIMLVVFAFNMVGDGLRDALDPRLRGVI